MRASKYLTTILISGSLALGACGDDDGGSTPTPDAAVPDAPAPDAEPDPTPDAMPTPEEMLWEAIQGYDAAGGDWAGFPGFDEIEAYTGHGFTHRQAFANDVFRDDLSALPNGAIIVKENLTDDQGTLDSITVMWRDSDAWVYAAYAADGTNNVYATRAELGDSGCTSSGCHGNDAETGNDEVFLNNQAVESKELYTTLTDDADGDDYDEWVTTFGDGAPAIFEPDTGHNVDFEQVFINDIADADEDALADGSILVKEERSAGTEADGSDSTLDALTIMLRRNATEDTWLWAKVTVADGKVKFAGESAGNACTNAACHGLADTGADKVFSNGMDN